MFITEIYRRINLGKEDQTVSKKDKMIFLTIILYISEILIGMLLPSFMVNKNFLIYQIVLTSFLVGGTTYIIIKGMYKEYQMLIHKLKESQYDDLTAAYNRRYFKEAFHSFFQEDVNCDKSCILIYFDLDNLKKVNDKYGHCIGDQMILTFSQAVKSHIRETDLFTRYGGDEFITVFFHGDKNLVEKRVQEIKDYLEDHPIAVGRQKISVKFSCGISTMPEDAKELGELIEVADERMYKEKRRHKMQINLNQSGV